MRMTLVSIIIFQCCVSLGATQLESQCIEGLTKNPILAEQREGYIAGTQPKWGRWPSIKYPETPAAGSLSEQLEYRYLGTKDDNHYYGFPMATRMNMIFGLDANSTIRAIPMSHVSDGDHYQRNLSVGHVEVSTHSPHDSLDHFIGYLLISKTPEWEKAKFVFKRYFELQDSQQFSNKNLEEAKHLKDKLAAALEESSDDISMADRLGQFQRRQILINDICLRINEIWTRMNYVVGYLL